MERAAAIGENIKYFREKCGLTQRELAEKIGYTEKSVSKWERRQGLPTVETLLMIADILHVTLAEIVQERTERHYLLGIDGGGTKTAFCLADDAGKVIKTAVRGSSNPNDVGFEKAQEALKDGIQEVCAGIPYGSVTLFAGISGGGLTGGNAAQYRKFFEKFGFYAFENGSDIENLAALADCEKCVLVIMGTGFIAFSLCGEEKRRVAGWGQLFDDGGCGYTLGRDAITAALRETDGSGEKTMLTQLLLERLGETAEKHLDVFYRRGKQYIASFADCVFAAAEMGDCVAARILDRNMAYAAQMIDTAAAAFSTQERVKVFVSGGVAARHETLFPLLRRFLKTDCELIYLQEEPVMGAVRRAKRLLEERNTTC